MVAAVTLRTKLALVFAALALLPLLAVSLLEYRAGAGAVEALLLERAEGRASRAARNVERILSSRESHLLELAGSEPLREYAARLQAARAQTTGAQGGARASAEGVPDAVRARFGAYFDAGREHLQAVTCLDSTGAPVFRVRAAEGGRGVVFQTADFVTGEVRYDARVWEPGPARSLRGQVSREPYGGALRVTAPVAGGGAERPAGAVVAEIRLGDVVKEADGVDAPGDPASEPAAAAAARTAGRSLVALDNATDSIVYHTNSALCHQAASAAMPYFAAVAARMRAGESGSGLYDTAEGDRQLASFRQVTGLSLSLAASEDYTAAVAPVGRAARVGAGLGLLAGLAGLGLLFFVVGRETRGIDRVARGASAIAAGNLDQRIEISTSGETRELAENFNAMTERLRELIGREAETRQFQSFLRISAMVSHDLKNAIAGLSMLVSNMERQFHREEFRADAIESLREATEKLKRTVARLSEPARSLSGEYRVAARPTDLVPVIRRVLATNAEPSRPLYEIEARLPERLVATVEPERIENVVENLVINALEAMGAKGGRLTVEAGALDGDLVYIGISDTGVGMTDEFVRTRLFRPFSTTKSKGIGLGLFTCREVVEAHGGRLEVDSTPGAGTRFRVVLPSRLFNSGERREQPVKATAAAEVTRRPGSAG